ncbi:MAG: rRNA adenine N-6-methyltransferase family protein, partial [Dysgonamonadaceae bacterium]
MQPVKPKKSLGQHFLNDHAIAERISGTLDEFSQFPVLEVGPGTGMLTHYLLERKKDLKVVEIDWDSVAYLKQHYPQLNDRIIEGDF